METYILPCADSTILQLWASRYESQAVKPRNELKFIVKPWFMAQVAPHERYGAFSGVISADKGAGKSRRACSATYGILMFRGGSSLSMLNFSVPDFLGYSVR